MTTTTEAPWTTTLLREVLGRAHYERMRSGMHPHLRLPTWEELSPGSQEVHRSRQDYLLPTLIPTVINLAASVTNIMAA